MYWNTTLVVGMGLVFVSGSGPTATAAHTETAKEVQVALAEFKEQESTPKRNRIRPGKVIFKEFFAGKLSGRGPREELLYNTGEDDRLGWKEVVKLLGRLRHWRLPRFFRRTARDNLVLGGVQ
jgi:hypothetical protein